MIDDLPNPFGHDETPKAPATTTDQDRHEQIVEALHSGEKPGTVAARFGLNAGQVRNIHKAACSSPCPHKTQPAPPRPEAEPLPEPPPLRVVAANERGDDIDTRLRALDINPDTIGARLFTLGDDLTRPVPTLLRRTDGRGLLYHDRLNVLFGLPGGGKSWLAMLAMLETLASDRRVVIIDGDDIAATTALRARSLGGKPILDLFRNPNHVRYVNPDEAEPEVIEWLAQWIGDGMVFVDSAASTGAGTTAGDIDNWYRSKIAPFLVAGAGGLWLDHMPKRAQNRPDGPIHALEKKALVSGASLRVSVPKGRTGWTPDHAGTILITVDKDRSGGVGAEHEVVAAITGTPQDGDRLTLSVEPPSHQDNPDPASTEVEDRIAAQIYKTLLNAQDGLTISTIRKSKSVKGRFGTIGVVAEQMVAEGILTKHDTVYRINPDYDTPDDPTG